MKTLSIDITSYAEQIGEFLEELINDEEDLNRNVTLVCDDQQLVKPHITVLKAFSQVFQNIIYSKINDDPVIELKGIKVGEFETFLKVGDKPETVTLDNDDKNDVKMRIKEEVVENQIDKFLENLQNMEVKKDEDGNIRNVVVKTDKLKCLQCNKYYSHPSSLILHKKSVHSTEKAFSCTDCPQKFTRKYILQQHFEIVHLKLKYNCNSCKVQFSSKGYMVRHIKDQHPLRLRDKDRGFTISSNSSS